MRSYARRSIRPTTVGKQQVGISWPAKPIFVQDEPTSITTACPRKAGEGNTIQRIPLQAMSHARYARLDYLVRFFKGSSMVDNLDTSEYYRRRALQDVRRSHVPAFLIDLEEKESKRTQQTSRPSRPVKRLTSLIHVDGSELRSGSLLRRSRSSSSIRLQTC